MSHDQIIDDLIVNIVQTEVIAEQSDLQQSLKKRGYDIPQATLSRRLKKMKIAKVAGLYKVIDYHQPGLPLVLNIQVSDFGLIVLQTHPGNASSLAYYLDRKYVSFSANEPAESGILGTIAGDDTVLLIVKSKAHQQQVCALLHQEFPYLLMS
ncbi:arginine repressor [Legionella erythra]|uniref:Arginine repressor n=1 Tax=Legionella erythra TaxID=448 RepID=A0A0W0TQG0_LEGER|nr:ArgR family transcriptional regulator [Legionella erythra]KTC97707.1 arginine repressor [Legionella erythra]